MSYAPVNLQLRLRYDGAVIEKGSSIDELFAGLNSLLYYLLEEKGPENSVRKNS
ncbi:MAG: hypothetical protein NHB15_04335 [Methanosarcina barkeri]|nr:hypothetical protein [Methanosarcina sp. ERenArc_MAG2]